MKVFTMRIHLEGGAVIDKLSSTNDKEAHIQEYLARGVRTAEGDCLVIYPARLITKVEVYEQGSAPPIGKKDPKPRATRARGRSAGEAGGSDEEQG